MGTERSSPILDRSLKPFEQWSVEVEECKNALAVFFIVLSAAFFLDTISS